MKIAVIAREGGRSSKHRHVDYHKRPGVLDAPPSRGMTMDKLWRIAPQWQLSLLHIIERHAPKPQCQIRLEM